MSAFLKLPPENYYVPSTMGELAGQTEAQCQAACKGIPNCVGITTTPSGGCKFMQLSDLGKVTPDEAGAPMTSFVNCQNLCNTSLLTCPLQKFAGVSLYVWLAIMSVLLALAVLYANTTSTNLKASKSTNSILYGLGASRLGLN